jgi:hypothetical protein
MTRRPLRAICGLLLAALLGAGFWQCGDEGTGSLPGSFALTLRRAPGDGGGLTVEAIEIEIARAGEVVASDTTGLDSSGAFATSFVLPPAEGYTVSVYAVGTAGAPWPDGTRESGVVATGEARGVDVPAGRLAEATILLAPALARLLGIDGVPGSDSIRVHWSRVAGATAYRLGWYAARTGELTTAPAVADTHLTRAWGDVFATARGQVPGDSVLFRVQPEFAGRDGVFGDGLWRDLSFWLDLPALVTCAPGEGETVDAEGLVVELVFDRGMAIESFAEGVRWEHAADGAPVAFTVEAVGAAPASAVHLVPAGVPAMGVPYRVTITTAVQDADGRPFDADPQAEGLQSRVVTWSTAPYAPLAVTGMVPAAGVSNVARETTVRLRFNRAVQPATIDATSLYLTDSWGTRLTAAAVEVEGDSILWRPAQPLWYATACTVHVATTVTDLAGKHLDQDPETYPQLEPYRARFTTLPQPEGPRVIAMDPDSGSVAAPLDAPIRIEFSEPVDPATVQSTTTFRLLRGGTVGIPGTISADATRRIFSYHPGRELDRGERYLVRLTGEGTGGGIRDLAGVPLDQDRSRPGYQPFEGWLTMEIPPAVITTAFEPARADTFVHIDATLTLTFARSLDPASVTGDAIRLTHGGDAVPAALTLAPDRLTLRVDPAAPLDWLTAYTLTADTLLTCPDGGRFDQDPLTPGRQAYVRRFTTEPESAHAAVATVSPADSATGVPVTSAVHITFTRAIDPATVTGTSFVLEQLGPGGATPVAGTVAANELSATFTPASTLAFVGDYRVRVTSAVTDASGLLGLDQDPATAGLQPFASEFHTTHEMVPPRVESVFPGSGASGVDIDTQVALLFSEAMDRGALASAFHLQRAGTNAPGTGLLDANGRIYTFTPASPLDWSTTYAVVVDSTARDLAGNALDGNPAQPGADGYVSLFQTETDRVGPRVIARVPAAGSERVGPDVIVRTTFSEALDAASVGPGSFRVLRSGTPVPGRVTLEAGDSVVAWVPVALPDSSRVALEFGTLYAVVADTLLTDRVGNRLDQQPTVPLRQPDVAFFTTMPETLAPRVSVLLPGTSDVPVHAHPALVFSEPMDAAALLAAGVVSLTHADAPVPATLELSASGDTLTLAPAALFAYSSEYAVRVETQATDRHGNRLDQEPALSGRQPYAITFATESDLDPPFVIAVSPVDGAPHASPRSAVVVAFSEEIDPSTVHSANIYLSDADGMVPLAEEPRLDPGGTVVTLTPAAPLTAGAVIDLIVSYLVSDLAGNEMTHGPGQPAFWSHFTVGIPPVVVWGGGLCATSDTTGVLFDASGSYDPGAGDSVAVAIWDWGDGTRDSLAAPAGLIATHVYGCLDVKGCDGLDNDGDGAIDETGAAGCDESHRVILEVRDSFGLAGADTAGVAFCAFLVLGTEPAPGGRLELGGSLRITLSRPLDPATLDTALVVVDLADTARVDYATRIENGNRTIVVDPTGLHGGGYRLELSPLLATPDGVPLDQELCLPGRQRFTLDFYGPVKPPPIEPDGQDGGDERVN